jgi:hypothetical protein
MQQCNLFSRPVRISLFVMLAVAADAWVVGCQSTSLGGRPPHSSIPVLGEDAAHVAGLSVRQVQDAVALCAAKCARCHQFYDPAHYNQAEWDKWLGKMSKKARLKPEQQELLSRYLAAVRAAK